MAVGWADFRSRTWVWSTTVQFAFFNLITWAPWMLLGAVEGRAYLGGAAVWGAILAVQGAGAITAGLLCLGRRPGRPMVVATIGTFFYALPDIPMAFHATAPWVAVAAFGCGAGSAVFATFEGTAMQQQDIPPGSVWPGSPHSRCSRPTASASSGMRSTGRSPLPSGPRSSSGSAPSTGC